MTEPVKFLSSRFLSASTLVGAHVRNPQDESLGDLKDFMIDSTSGKIAYGVLSFGGVLGIGHKLFAIPWDNFRVDAETERLVLDVSKDRLKDAPGFDQDHWPNFAEPTFESEVRQHYATRPARDGNIIHPE
ncbi:MAG TPA: PRC-barrel domain-containing protein [Rhodanobacteraceae bacterium]|nr:PRC-barrel domain-containing protein [Rhodanobacteraceae bacterium]